MQVATNVGNKVNQMGNFKELSVGAGSTILKANREGFFMGASNYTGGKIKLSYGGNAYFGGTFAVGTSLTFNGTALAVTGTITATGGSITGDFSISGDLSVTSKIVLGTGGSISRGKTSYASTAAGFWLDNTFHIGSSATKYFKYDGTDLEMLGGTITGGTIQTATTGYRTILNSSNVSFYNSDTHKGFLRPDSYSSMVLGTADDLWITDLNGNPKFKFNAGGELDFITTEASINFASGRKITDMDTYLDTNGNFKANGYCKADSFYVGSSAGQNSGGNTRFITDIGLDGTDVQYKYRDLTFIYGILTSFGDESSWQTAN